MENIVNNQGNNNIIIQGVTDSSITLEVNGATQEIQNEMAVLHELLEQMNAEQVKMADKVFSLSQLGQADLGVKKTFNVLMTKRLMQALSNNGLSPAQKFLSKTSEGWENNSRFSDVAKNLITFAFVGVLGIQLRKIMAIGKEPLSNSKQQNYIENSYLIGLKAIQLIIFTLLSAFWDKQKTASYALEAEEAQLISRFFEDSIERDLEGYMELLEVLLAIFQRHELELPFPDLANLKIERLKKVAARIQKLKADLDKSQHSLMSCFEIESQLTRLLEQLIFLTNYKMLSVKSISYDEQRISPPQYIHNYVELGIDQKFNENTEKINIVVNPVVSDAVLIYHKSKDYKENFNLSPFVIDFNTHVFESGVKVCFYAAKHISDGSLNYRFLEDNAVENIEFQGILDKNESIQELLKEKENHKKIKLDNIIQQFQEAQKTILKDVAGTKEEVSFDDLFD
jgi:hypothetical protein